MPEAELQCDVLVVGSGPAGLSAAVASASQGANTIILERLDRPGLKLLASGGGRCNLGNTLDATRLMASFGRNGRFMSKALEAASPEWVRSFLAERGVECVAADSFHYFPKSGRATDVLNAFLNEARKLGAGAFCDEKLEELKPQSSSFIAKTSKRSIEARCVVLAAGGCAWPALGGSRSGMELAKKLGHSIAKPLPAMAPVLLSDNWAKGLAGVSLKESRLILDLGPRKRFESEGELLFTHDGLSGPAALDISGEVSAACDETQAPVPLKLQIKPHWGRSEWLAEMAKWRSSDAKKLVRSVLARHVPHSLSDALCGAANCPDSPCCELKASDRDHLAEFLAETPLTASGAGPMNRSMAMRGGVSLKEVEPKTLESRLQPGAFFAGELLDLTGPCGGYNIQWAFSSGRLAGLSAAARALASDAGKDA